MMWRNEHNLFKKTDAHSGEKVFSAYSEDSKVKVYNNDFWWSDNWEAADYGKEYDFSRPFFDQFLDLLHLVPLPARVNANAIHSDYSNNAGSLKNCYLCFNGNAAEDCFYGINFNNVKKCINFSSSSTSEECGDVCNITDCYKVFMTTDAADCVDVSYSFDCRNCSNCVGCVGLRHKNYHIFNLPYSKEEYFKIKAELDLGSYTSHKKIIQNVADLIEKHPRKYMHTMKSINISGDYVFGSKNVKHTFMSYHGYDVKYSQQVRNTTDTHDTTVTLEVEGPMYESVACGIHASDLKFCFECHPSNIDLSYCIFCSSSSHLFGCVGLRKKEYCILNKQYSKEEYFEMLEKIKKQIDELPYTDYRGCVYKFGEFFPPEFSPFSYNDTIVQEYFPLTKELASELKYNWRDYDKKSPEATILNDMIEDDIKDVPDSYVEELLECADRETCGHNCSKVFKITTFELSFYKKNLIPIPRKCPNCRHYDRIQHRNLEYLALYKRSCMCGGAGSPQVTGNHGHEGKCEVEFETSYSPDRPEIVYCEKCYQQEVY